MPSAAKLAKDLPNISALLDNKRGACPATRGGQTQHRDSNSGSLFAVARSSSPPQAIKL
jgi:hypothetical protein